MAVDVEKLYELAADIDKRIEHWSAIHRIAQADMTPLFDKETGPVPYMTDTRRLRRQRWDSGKKDPAAPKPSKLEREIAKETRRTRKRK